MRRSATIGDMRSLLLGFTIAVWMRPDALTFAKTQGSLTNQQYVHWLTNHEWAFRMYSQTNPPGPRANRISFYVFNPSGGRGCGHRLSSRLGPPALGGRDRDAVCVGFSGASAIGDIGSDSKRRRVLIP